MSTRMTTGLLAFLVLISTGTNTLAESLPEQVARLERELTTIKHQLERAPARSTQQSAKGSKGERGEQGPPGQKGDKGEPGPSGVLSVPGISFGNGWFAFSNPAGKKLAHLGAASSGSDSVMQLFTSSETKVVELSSGDKGGAFARFYNHTGKEVAYIGSDTSGKGRVEINGAKVLDYAEVFELAARQGVGPGTVMAVAGPEGRIAPSAGSYDPRVVGVVSGAGGLRPGSVIGSREDGSNDLPVAVSGQVAVRICLEGGPIEPGDLLVASSRPGVAMRAADPNRATGAVVGKALEAFGSGQGKEGLVRMMVMLR
ncbi:MAG TPA: collagen-like protein [Thermoanaerobaculia bacterium]|nr:collagen-like protein [Thermoanaerobaculia bacterium]